MGRPRPAWLASCAASGAMGRLYGPHVEVGVGSDVELRVESDDDSASGSQASIGDRQRTTEPTSGRKTFNPLLVSS